MEEALRQLLEALESIGEDHEDVYDTVVRERMYAAVIRVLINPKDGYVLPAEFGMFTPEGNAAVHHALAQCLPRLVAAAEAAGLTTPQERLLAFQNDDVATSGEGNYYDDFFGYVDPEETEW